MSSAASLSLISKGKQQEREKFDEHLRRRLQKLNLSSHPLKIPAGAKDKTMQSSPSEANKLGNMEAFDEIPDNSSSTGNLLDGIISSIESFP